MKHLHTHGPLVVVLLMLPLAAGAQLFFDPVGTLEQGRTELGGTIGFSDVEYEVDGNEAGSDGDVERTWIAAHGGVGLNEGIDVLLAVAGILEAEPDDFGNDGDGFALAGGLRGEVWAQDRSAVRLYGQLSFIAEDYGKSNKGPVSTDGELELTELTIGALYVHSLDEGVSFFAGIEAVPFSDGELEAEIKNPALTLSQDLDAERDNLFGVRLGARVDLATLALQADAAIAHEETFRFSVVRPL
jgi:hypothetical protein